MKRHELKTHPKPFAALAAGEKTFEWRKDDRHFEVGDMLVLQRYVPETETFEGGELIRWVSYIIRGPAYGIPDGFCIMSVALRRPDNVTRFELMEAEQLAVAGTQPEPDPTPGAP